MASAAIGLNRREQDRPVGLRTTMLVALAAAIAMIQVNILLPLAGKPDGSFVVMDLLRLPLGILSGIEFIGAGAIVRRDNLVQGVTTAATLWFVTVMACLSAAGSSGWASPPWRWRALCCSRSNGSSTTWAAKGAPN